MELNKSYYFELGPGNLEYRFEDSLDYCFCHIDELLPGEKVCFIESLFVEKEFRRKGAGSACLDSFLAQMKEKGIKKFYLWCQVNSEDYLGDSTLEEIEKGMPGILSGIMSFYHSFGFSEGCKVNHWSNMVDMALVLD